MRWFFENMQWGNLIKMAVILLLLFLTVLYTIPWTLRNSLENDYSGIDFHGYWYAGHYIRQGVNSYAVILNNPAHIYWDPQIPGSGDPNWCANDEYSLKLPIRYLDTVVIKECPVAQTLIVAPSVTAPLNLLIGLLSWFSWQSARLIWMILNLTFAATAPWLAIHLIEKKHTLKLLDRLIFALIFYNIYGLRQSIVVGQQSLICLIFLLLALLLKDNWMASGILLGFGISKYSVGLPVFIDFLIKKKYRTVLTGIAVQILGILFLIPFERGSPKETLMAYYRALYVNYSQNGVHLLARFPATHIKTVLFLIITSIAFFFFAWQYTHYRSSRFVANKGDLINLTVLTLTIFLVTYHRIHDMPFMIFFLLLLMIEKTNGRKLSFKKPLSIIFFLMVSGIVGLLLFPTMPNKIMTYLGINHIISDNWSSPEAASTISLLLMFILSVWIGLRRLIEIASPRQLDIQG